MDDDQNYHGQRSPEELIKAIDESFEADDKPSHAKYIRPSSLGHECGRVPFFDFWWATPPKKTEGRILRLFKTGERQEDLLIQYLKTIGWEIVNRDPESNGTKQLSITTLDGHAFGYLDGAGRDRVVNGPWAVIEAKTHNKTSFNALKKHGVAAAKIEHYAQMQLYMRERGLEDALYIAICKDDEKPHIEYVKYDRGYTDRLLAKGEMILRGSTLPTRISKDPDYFKCRNCRHNDVCHQGVVPEKNCRTCKHSCPLSGGKWGCEKHSCMLEKALMLTGCADYELADVFAPGDVTPT